MRAGTAELPGRRIPSLSYPRAESAQIVGTFERLAAVLFLFVITGGVVRLLVEGPKPDLSEMSVDFGVLVELQSEVETTSAFGRLLTVPIYAAVTIFVLISWPQIWAKLMANKLLLCVLLVALVSGFWSIDPPTSFRRAAGVFLCSSYAIYLSLRFGTDELFRILTATFIGMAVLSLLFVLAMPGLAVMDSGAWRGIFTHKNGLGNVMAWGLVCCWVSILACPRRRGILLVGLPFIIVSLVFSKSMTSIVGAFIVCNLVTFLWICRRVQTLTPLVLAGLGCLLGLITMLNLVPSGEALGAAVGKDPTLTGRTDLWATVWWWIQQKIWLGYGFGAFWTRPSGPGLEVQQMIGWPAPHSHNGILEIWLGLGAFGVMPLIAFLGKAGFQVMAAYRTRQGVEQIACLGVFVLLLFFNVTEVTVLTTGPDWLLALAAVMCLSGSGRRDARRGRCLSG